ncbi:MAG: hypothetical protein EBY16_03730 [Gammaproteobacteria bacterium]|nr:hypothetical protein [Gammaproteobacteria bacterium]
MKKKIQVYGILVLISIAWMRSACALTGNMFQIESSGIPATIPIKLCLSAGTSKPNSQSGCQTYTVTGTRLNIRLINLKASHTGSLSTCRTYTNVGIGIQDSNYTVASGATLNPATGLFVFSATCGADSTIILTPTAGTATLTASISELALSVSGLTEYGVTGNQVSGVPRTIMITNTGTVAATNLLVQHSTFPRNTQQTTTCTNTLAAGSSCSITIVPSTTASSGGSGGSCITGITPNPSLVFVSADNAANVSTNVYILGYGCVYKGGYIYAFDDTTSNTSSVGGKVVTTTNQAAAFPSGIIWSSNGLGADSGNVSYDIIPGIDDSSTSSSAAPTYINFTTYFGNTYTNLNPFNEGDFSACDGNKNGLCNTSNILAFYSTLITNYSVSGIAPFTATLGLSTPQDYYPTGLCKKTIATYSDWYLPAICEMGYAGVNTQSGCGSDNTPTLQNIQSNLVDTLNLLNEDDWSSTESSIDPRATVWMQAFHSGNSVQRLDDKNLQHGVRCSRVF